MRLRSRVPVAVAIVPLLSALLAQQPVPAPPEVDFVAEHCVGCHGDRVKGGMDLTVAALGDVDALWRWRRLRARVAAGEMPPPDDSEVGDDERRAFVAWVDQLLAERVPQLPLDPGRATVRRLNRSQWRNAVADLLGVDADTSQLPVDDLAYGFDTIGDALTFSTLHLEKYLALAEATASQVFHGEDPEHPDRRVFAAGRMRLVDDRGANMAGDTAHMFTRATVEQVVTLPRDGEYRLRLVAGATQAGDEPAKMLLLLDGQELEQFEVPERKPREFTLTTPLRGGARRFAISFVNDYYDPENPDPQRRDRNLSVSGFVVEGPVDARPTPPQQQWLHDAWSEARARDDKTRLNLQIAALLERLWRRQPTSAELQRLQRAAQQRLAAGEALLDVQRFVLAAALASPNFLFREERAGRDAALAGTALASRLSFFLWASAPDAELLRACSKPAARDAEVLHAQVDRMLDDPRAERLASDFAAQWLELRALAERTPDPERFPGFDDAMRRSMARETELLFLSVLREQRDVRELLDCDHTFVDARLAGIYGLTFDPSGDEFQRVELPEAMRARGGLLGHASVLAITSNPTRTSPVKRGKWILENLLDQGPPPPPPGNDSFADERAIDSAASLRVQMAVHREREACAVCHIRMDSFGLALERYDAIGRFRDHDGAGPIDDTGELPDGRTLEGLAGLKRALLADPAFVHTVAAKLFVYAVGRAPRPVDRLRLEAAVAAKLAAGKVTLRDLVHVVVADPAFTRQARDD
ncbi:MAG: DUF1592 domain-containing protein [Planctomycetota bacterium]